MLPPYFENTYYVFKIRDEEEEEEADAFFLCTRFMHLSQVYLMKSTFQYFLMYHNKGQCTTRPLLIVLSCALSKYRNIAIS